ncbi:hypothetical protein Cgig2_002258 [Carnegiea gigantea]|uniref:Uncharacterized protein n=1 Tax=Carnegiea gigantea TaxID=171969 RepID=A0A9Q1QPZ5_9CARY|nr:hypothetical protein Cgig2_002258 [Carnegiea gigantea]
MVDKTPRSPPHRVIGNSLPEIPLPYYRLPSRKTMTLRWQRRVWRRPDMSFDLLRDINSIDLCESILLEIIHDDEPDFIPQATILALLEWQDIKSRRLSLTSPLSLDTSPDGSPDHNYTVLTPTHIAQPGELPMLDGVRPHHPSQSNTARPRPYAAALKFGLGSHSHSQVSPPEPKLHSQLPGSPTAITNSSPNPPPEIAQHAANAPQRMTAQAEQSGILLTLSIVMPNQGEDSSKSDPLLAMDNEEIEGMDAEDNADMYLNLEHLVDVEMSSDSTKRKRIEEGEECQRNATPVKKGVCFALASEEQCSSKAIFLTAFRPRTIVFIMYYTQALGISIHHASDSHLHLQK